MLVYDLFTHFYKELLLAKNILIISVIDVDALCSVKILTSIFQGDNLVYTVRSCSNRKTFRQIITNEISSYDSVICLNCAGMEPVTELCTTPNTTFYILDSNRPWHTSNIFNMENVNIIIDKNDDLDDLPNYDDIALKSFEGEQNINQDHRILKRYYAVSYCTTPTCKLIFGLLLRLKRENIHLLWCLICSITSYYVFGKISRESYVGHVTYLQEHLMRISMGLRKSELSEDSYNMSVTYSDELNLFLYRHWSLFDSFSVSPTISTQFKIWSVEGRRKLGEYFAHAGLPLKDAKQEFALMPLKFKENISDILSETFKKFRINNYSIPSFVASYGYQLKISAIDFVLLLSSIDFIDDDETDLNNHFMNSLRLLDKNFISLANSVITSTKEHIDVISKKIKFCIDLHLLCSKESYILGIITDNELFLKNSSGLILEFYFKYLQRAYVSLNQSKKVRKLPFIVCIERPEEDFTTILSLSPVSDKTYRNNFGKLISDFAKENSIEVFTNNFMPYIFEIKRSQRKVFLEIAGVLLDRSVV